MIERCSSCQIPEALTINVKLAESAIESFRTLAGEMWDTASARLLEVSPPDRSPAAVARYDQAKENFIGGQAAIISDATLLAETLDAALLDASTLECGPQTTACPRAEHIKRVIEQVLAQHGQ